MDTKLKGWTAVRIICFLLILVLCFGILNRVFASVARGDDTGIYADVVFADFSTDQYLFSRQMNNVLYYASIVAYFGSEEAIMAGMHLRWVNQSRVIDYGFYDPFHDSEYQFDEYDFGDDENVDIVDGEVRMIERTYEIELWAELRSPDGWFSYGSIGSGFSAPISRMRLESEAILEQLTLFRFARDSLSSVDGLIYYINVEVPLQTVYFVPVLDQRSFTRGGIELDITIPTVFTYGNIGSFSGATIDFFRSHSVYHIEAPNTRPEQSFPISNGFPHWFTQNFTDTTILLAFSNDAVREMHDRYIPVRDAYIIDISIIAGSAVLILGLLVILMVGAGRRNLLVNGVKVREEGVHFSPIDKPYLDIGLAFVGLWALFVLYIVFEIDRQVMFHRSITAINIIFAAAIVLVVPLALLWLMSFVKRIKAGRFWKHTLIYAIIYSLLYGSFRFLVRSAKALWAGTRLTLKVVLISFVAFCMMFFIGVIGAETWSIVGIFFTALLFTAVVTVLLLLYARRIRKLEQGARDAVHGKYDPPIDAGGGELGSIASSINNISAGINTAVEERMKSERLKTELITNVSHDIRTPLTSIITYTDLLDHEGLDCERAPEYLDVLKQKSLRLKTLTEELFEAAKAATGNIDVNLTDVNVGSLINQVLGELDTSIKSSGLDLRVSTPEKLYAKADGRLMQRVMENLLSNVFKYSQPGSRVYLDVTRTEDSKARIEIKNISATELNFDPSELTERFKRGDDSRTDGGSGLGLSIVQSFVEAQRGTFEITIDGDLFKATVLLPALPIVLTNQDTQP